MAVNPDDNSLALFCDFENIALGVRDARYQKFNIKHVLERLLVKGSIVVKKAYCDWDRYKEFKGPMHEAAFELIEIPHVRMSGKNSADIRMVVDALDLCYTKAHVDTFVIISGDSDFSPLVSKLRENAKTVIGVGVKNSTSDLLINSCDEFIYYDDLVREMEKQRAPGKRRGKKRSGSRRGKRGEGETVAAAADAAAAENAAADTAETSGHAADAASSTLDADAESQDGAPAERGKRGGRRGGRGRSKAGAAAPADAGLSSGEPDEVGAVLAEADDDTAGFVEFGPMEADDDSREEELRQEGIDLVFDTAAALFRERGGKDKLWGSMIKQTLKRRRPGFNESYYGFDSFSKMLEEAEVQGLLTLELDDRSGGHIIREITG